jgi:hypothetical protein
MANIGHCAWDEGGLEVQRMQTAPAECAVTAGQSTQTRLATAPQTVRIVRSLLGQV